MSNKFRTRFHDEDEDTGSRSRKFSMENEDELHDFSMSSTGKIIRNQNNDYSERIENMGLTTSQSKSEQIFQKLGALATLCRLCGTGVVIVIIWIAFGISLIQFFALFFYNDGNLFINTSCSRTPLTIAVILELILFVSGLHFFQFSFISFDSFFLLAAITTFGCISFNCSLRILHYLKRQQKTTKRLNDEYYDEYASEKKPPLFSCSTLYKCCSCCILALVTCIGIFTFLLFFAFFFLVVAVTEVTKGPVEGTILLDNGKVKYTIQQPPILIQREASNGMIHVIANTDRDLFFGQGYAAATERLWQLDFMRRVGRGTLSEIVGDAAFEVDRFSRVLNFKGVAESALQSLSPQTKDVLQGFVDGVNAYINSTSSRPIEFLIFFTEPEPFQVEDVILMQKLMFLDMSSNMMSEVERFRLLSLNMPMDRIFQLHPLFPDTGVTILNTMQYGPSPIFNNSGAYLPPGYSKETNLVLNLEQSFEKLASKLNEPQMNLLKQIFSPFFSNEARMSNNWVISGAHTATGKPILANDPHMRLTNPSTFLMMHLKSKTIDAVGATLPLCPGIVLGRTQHISWGFTNAMADVQDLYMLKESPTMDSYIFNGENRPYSIREEKIAVYGNNTYTIKVKESHLGPIVNSLFSASQIRYATPAALRWTALDSTDTTLDAMLALLKCKNWSEARSTLQKYHGPAQNMVFADMDGNIAYRLIGSIPQRKIGHTGLFPVYGTDDSYTWSGYVPFEQMPESVNPAEGYIITANNQITPMNATKNFVTYEAIPDTRARRIKELIQKQIQQKIPFTVQDTAKIQLDVKNLIFADFKFLFENMAGRLETDYEKWRLQILQWDGTQNLTSTEAALFEYFLHHLGDVTKRETGTSTRDLFYLHKAFKSNDDIACINFLQTSCVQFAVTTFKMAVDKVSALKLVGESELYDYSFLHKVYIKHPLLTGSGLGCMADRSISFAGGTDTVSVSYLTLPEQLSSTYAPAYRQIIDMRNLQDQDSKWILAPGQSGNIFVSNYDLLLTKWSKGLYEQMNVYNYTTNYQLELK